MATIHTILVGVYTWMLHSIYFNVHSEANFFKHMLSVIHYYNQEEFISPLVPVAGIFLFAPLQIITVNKEYGHFLP